MKTLAIIIFISFLIIGCKGKSHSILQSKKEVAEYHLRVKPHGESCDWFMVQFTNDNFITSETINDTWDVSNKYMGSSIVKQLALFKTESEAVQFAKQFTTYQKCISYNDTINLRYQKLKTYRDAHPVFKEELLVNSEPKCAPATEVRVY